MSDKHGLTLTKSATKHKVPCKTWSIKRKLGEFKEEFIKFRDNNTSKVKFNKCCEANGLEDCKVNADEADTSKKIEPNVGFCKCFVIAVLLSSNNFNNFFIIYFALFC